MALTFEDIVRKKLYPTEQPVREDPYAALDEELDERLGDLEEKYKQRMEREALEPPIETPSLTTRVIDTGKRVASDVGKTLVGSGEAALSLGTGIASGLVGDAYLAGKGLYENLPTRDYIEQQINATTPKDPDYWKKLLGHSKELASKFTYEPRTQAGQETLAGVGTLLKPISQVADIASNAEPLKSLFTEDQRALIQHGFEVALMVGAGEFAGSTLRGLRGKVGAFKKEFSKIAGELPSGERLALPEGQPTLALPPGGRLPSEGGPPIVTPAPLPKGAEYALKPPTESLMKAASDLITHAESVPEIASKLELAHGINPRLLPELRGRANEILARLKENPENAEYLYDARAFIENTRDVPDRRLAEVKQEINSFAQVGELPMEARISRLQRLQENPYSALDLWLARNERSSLLGEMEPPKPLPIEMKAEATPALRVSRKMQDQERRVAGQPINGINESVKAERAATIERYKNMSTEELLGTIRDDAPSRPKMTVDEKIEFANNQASVFNEPKAQKLIQEAIERGDKELPKEVMDNVSGMVNSEFAKMKYEEAVKAARKGMNDSAQRTVKDVISDILDLVSFDVDSSSLGMSLGNVMLSHRQKMAAQRLAMDAKKAGRDFNEYLEETNLSPIAKTLIKNYIKTQALPEVPVGVGPRNMRLDTESLPGGTDSPTSRIINGKPGTPIYPSEERIVQNAPIAELTSLQKAFATPIRVAEKFGPDVQKITIIPERVARKAVDAELKTVEKDLAALRKIVGHKARMDMLEGKFDTPNVKKLNSALTQGVNGLLDRVNAVRRATGGEEIPYPKDALQFIRGVVGARAQGDFLNLGVTPVESILAKVAAFKNGSFPKTWTQKALRMSGEHDPLFLMDQFSEQALRAIHYSPISSKLRELANHPLSDPVGSPALLPGMGRNEGWKLAENNPALHKFLNDFADYAVDGMNRHKLGKHYGVDFDALAGRLMQNQAFAAMAWYGRSVMAQPMSLINTYHATSMQDIMYGLKENLAGILHLSSEREKLIGESKVLSSRKGHSSYHEAGDFTRLGSVLDNLKEGRLRNIVDANARIGMLPLEFADYESAVISGLTAKNYGKRMGLKGNELINFVDDIIIKTQASGARADKAPIQQSTLGRLATQFGTFTISDWNYYVNDVFKFGKDVSTVDKIKSVARMFGALTAFSTLYEVLHMDSPAPIPGLEGYDRLADSKDPLRDGLDYVMNVTQAVPLLGSARYGKGFTGGVVGSIGDLVHSTSKNPMAPNPLEPASKLLGVPASGWYLRATRKKNDERNVWERIMNYKEPEESKGRGLSSGLKGGRKGGLKSGLR